MNNSPICSSETSPQSSEKNQELPRNSFEDNMFKFRELLMRENLDIVGKLKQYKKTDFRRKIVLDQWKELKRLSELSKVWVSVPFVKKKFDSPVITVDSSKAGSNIDALRLAINDLGWKEYPNGCNKSCHVVWNSCNFNENRNNNGSFVNKHPGITQCLNKVAFSRILETMRTLFPDHYSFYPLTWYLPHQMIEFSLYCRNQMISNKKENYYIVKPDAGTQGDGIYLIQKPEDYKMSPKTFVVQEYLANPLLLDGYKFDLRIYSILLSLDPLKVYLCNEGLARFCTKRYIPPSSDNLNISYMHLTNYSLNKKSNEFVHTQKLDSGSKRTVSSVFAFLEAEGYNVDEIWEKLEELVYKTVLAIVPQLKVHYINEVLVKSDGAPSNQQPYKDRNRPTCFQILGFDVLIMDNLQPILLEVNSNPSMRLDCEMEFAPGLCEYYLSKVDVKIKKPLIRDTLKLLQKDICNKFDLNMKEANGAGNNCSTRVNADKSNEEQNKHSRENSPSSEKENLSKICRKGSTESQYGPYFMAIAKKNNILPKYFETSSRNSPSKEIISKQEDSELQVKDVSPQIDETEEQDLHETSWLNKEQIDCDEKTQEEPILQSDDSKLKVNLIEKKEKESCLTLISRDSYKYLFEDLRILEETTIIFYSAMGHRYCENMGATSFRTFGRQCKLHELGFNHAMIDLIYIEVQHQWSFISNLDSKQGLCYQAFLEAFFRIAFAKFSDLPKCAAVQNLIDHCKRSIGLTNFNWTKTLYRINEHRQPRPNEVRSSIKPKGTKRYPVLTTHSNNLNLQKPDPNSSSSEKSFESVEETLKEKRKEKWNLHNFEPRQSKFELIKAIHEFYRNKLQTPKPPKTETNQNNDSDSVRSLSRKDERPKSKTPKLPYIIRREIISNQKSQMRMYMYEKSESSLKYQENMTERKSLKLSQKEQFLKTDRSVSPNNRSDNKSGYKASQKPDKSYMAKLVSENSGNGFKSDKLEIQSNRSPQLTPLNCNDRMRKLIEVYGAESQNYLKRSLDKLNKKYPTLKPL